VTCDILLDFWDYQKLQYLINKVDDVYIYQHCSLINNNCKLLLDPVNHKINSTWFIFKINNSEKIMVLRTNAKLREAKCKRPHNNNKQQQSI
jgi:hypothetical protein